MKTLTAVIYTLLFICSAVFPDQPAADKNSRNQWPQSVFPVEPPVGNVRLIKETAYTMTREYGADVRELKYTLMLRYSPEGLLQSEEYYNADGSPANRIDYTYENGMLVLKTQSHPSVQNPDREIFVMSADGRILEAEKIFSKGNYGWKYRNSYDHNGRIVLTSKYDRYWKWQLVYSRMFEYDESGRIVATEGFGMKSELLWRDEHRYNENGLIRESIKYNPDGELVVRILNEYNDAGMYTRREFFDHNGHSYAVYTYGWNFDEQGNWIAKITGSEAKGSSSAYIIPDSMVLRDIEYYE